MWRAGSGQPGALGETLPAQQSAESSRLPDTAWGPLLRGHLTEEELFNTTSGPQFIPLQNGAEKGPTSWGSQEN